MPVSMSNADAAAFSAAFARAEKTLKRFERLGGKTLETAINQLRYAARDYLDAQNAGDAVSQKVVFGEAIAHCRRAEYDAIDASIASVGRSVVEFNERYSQSSVIAIMPNYPDIFAKAMTLLNDFSTEEAPRNVSPEDLGAYGKKLDELVALWLDIAVKQPLVERLDFERRLEQKLATRRHLTNVLLATLGILVAIVAAIVSKAI